MCHCANPRQCRPPRPSETSIRQIPEESHEGVDGVLVVVRLLGLKDQKRGDSKSSKSVRSKQSGEGLIPLSFPLARSEMFPTPPLRKLTDTEMLVERHVYRLESLPRAQTGLSMQCLGGSHPPSNGPSVHERRRSHGRGETLAKMRPDTPKNGSCFTESDKWEGFPSVSVSDYRDATISSLSCTREAPQAACLIRQVSSRAAFRLFISLPSFTGATHSSSFDFNTFVSCRSLLFLFAPLLLLSLVLACLYY